MDNVPIAGQVFWVDSTQVKSVTDGSKSNPGTHQKPFATLGFAIGRCEANRGDVIYLKHGHVELISEFADININVPGISIIGLGIGTLQPRMNFTVDNKEVTVNANNISIININFHTNIFVSCGLSINPSSTDCLVKRCKFDVENTGTTGFVTVIEIGDNCNHFIIEDNIIDM